MAEEIKRKRARKQPIQEEIPELMTIEDINEPELMTIEDINEPELMTIEDINEPEVNEGTQEEPIKEKAKIIKKDLPAREIKQEMKSDIQSPRSTYRVFVRGTERYLTKSAIKAVSKDPSLNLQIPEDTDFELPNVRKCKDC